MSDVVILGGTGTLGTAIIEYLMINRPDSKITVLSRDENKQQAQKNRYPWVNYAIGDVRNIDSVSGIMKHADLVFHVAAMKHIDVVEDNLEESFKTNVIGTFNVGKCAQNRTTVVFSSTDKAVLPINGYGMQKAISEKYLLSLNQNRRSELSPIFNVFRWGNVVGSRGSVVNSFANTLEKENKIYLTHPDMTRFWINIEDAVAFMFDNIKQPPHASIQTEVKYPKMKASSVIRMAESIARFKGINHYEIVNIGLRKGEKIHECLDSNHEFCIRSDTAPQLTDDELDAMVRKVI